MECGNVSIRFNIITHYSFKWWLTWNRDFVRFLHPILMKCKPLFKSISNNQIWSLLFLQVNISLQSRVSKPRNRMALKRMQSFPAPELKDQNHNNHKIQKLLNLVQALKEEEPKPRPRRLSLPLPTNNPLQNGNFPRGSLQVFSPNAFGNRFANGYQRHRTQKSVDLLLPVGKSVDFIIGDETYRPRRPSVTVIDVISAEPPSEIVRDRRTVMDLEGLQCTRVWCWINMSLYINIHSFTQIPY